MPKFHPIPIPPPFTPPAPPRSSSEPSASAATDDRSVANDPLTDREAVLDECQQRLGYTFQDREILRRSLTHSSCAATRLDCNERMEFLGDAVLGMVVCEFLYHRYPDRREGQLTQQKSYLVSRNVCSQVDERLQLHQLMFVGKGLQSIPESLKAAVIESVIAGIYLDGGFDAASEFILRAFQPELDSCSNADAENYKSLLQEETQRDSSVTPSYVIVEQRGPDHAREFQVAVEIGEQRFDTAWGRSKKEAEQKAAMLALEALNSVDTASDATAADATASVQDESATDSNDETTSDSRSRLS